MVKQSWDANQFKKNQSQIMDPKMGEVEGWLTNSEAALLYHLAKNCAGRGVIVEIGSWKGKSTICLAQGSKNGKKIEVFAIDPHTGSSEHQQKHGAVNTLQAFINNIARARVDDIVVPIVKTSQEASTVFETPIELIFIDGGHEYEIVDRDFQMWFPKVMDGGIIAFHDTIKWSGPKKVVEDCLFKSKRFKYVRFVDSITFGQKVPANSLLDRLQNLCWMHLKNLHEWVGRYTPFYLLERLHDFAERRHIPKSIRTMAKKALGCEKQ